MTRARSERRVAVTVRFFDEAVDLCDMRMIERR